MKTAIVELAQKYYNHFRSRGGVPFDTDILQPAKNLLDLYGEDIRSRAFVTDDGFQVELMLRPDFTVPLAKYHMENVSESVAYIYQGPVFRRQWSNSARPREYLQVGYELFGNTNREDAEAEVFSVFYEVLNPMDLRPITGDLGLLIEAVECMSLTDDQKNALKRHLWYPKRFRGLLEQWKADNYRLEEEEVVKSNVRRQILDAGQVIGQRSVSEVIENVIAKHSEARAPKPKSNEIEAIDGLLEIKCTMIDAVQKLDVIANCLKGLRESVDTFSSRIDALSQRGIKADSISFEADFGRTSLEYYSGFVFGFLSEDLDQPVALGGRYDFLTESLGNGRKCPAVGGMLRPELLLNQKGDSN